MKILIRSIITLTLIIIILWFRVFKERTSLDLNDLVNKDNQKFIIIIIIILLINFLILLTLFNTIILKNRLGGFIKKTLPLQVLMVIITFIVEAPQKLYNEYSDKYDLFTNQIEMSASYI